MLVDKTVKVEQNIDATLTEIKNVIIALKSGKPLAEVALAELMKLQSVVKAAAAIPGEVSESVPSAVLTVILDAEDMVMTILGVAQPL